MSASAASRGAAADRRRRVQRRGPARAPTAAAATAGPRPACRGAARWPSGRSTARPPRRGTSSTGSSVSCTMSIVMRCSCRSFVDARSAPRGGRRRRDRRCGARCRPAGASARRRRCGTPAARGWRRRSRRRRTRSTPGTRRAAGRARRSTSIGSSASRPRPRGRARPCRARPRGCRSRAVATAACHSLGGRLDVSARRPPSPGVAVGAPARSCGVGRAELRRWS